jgi:hypothetical protein
MITADEKAILLRLCCSYTKVEKKKKSFRVRNIEKCCARCARTEEFPEVLDITEIGKSPSLPCCLAM